MTRHGLLAVLPGLLLLAGPAIARQAPAAPSRQVTFEHYYRIKWGQDQEFKRLYRKNHESILREMQKAGFIVAMRTDVPFTHMAGGERWDMRVTITYRDAASAVEMDGAFDQAFAAASKKLFPDEATLEAEEARRFALLDEHWDVIVVRTSD